MTLFLFLYTLELGYTPELDTTTNNMQEIYYLSFSPDLVFFEILHITGTARIDMYYEDTLSFNPVSLSSLVDIYLQYSYFTIGFRHLCQHPIIAWENSLYPLQSFDQSYNQFYLQISNKEVNK